MTTPNPVSPFKCLILDDDLSFAALLVDLVRNSGGIPTVCSSVKAAREALELERFELACIDNRLPDGTGFDFYSQLMQRHPQCVTIMITGAPELGQAVQLTKNGLFDYLTKPLNAEELVACLARARRRMESADASGGSEDMVGSSPVMLSALQLLRQAARHPTATVLLLGETGTGKDLAARLLHKWTFQSSHPAAPYLALNCPAVPTEMFEAELFGNEKGAYTGAEKRRIGLVEAAEGGTLFLDEVTEIPLAVQAKLLRFLESREYRPLGSTVTRYFTGRIVAATNRSLQDEVQKGRFREDLLYRLDVTSIRIPALRERLADLEAIAEFLLTQLCTKYQRRKPQFKPADLQALARYEFPGNVRELRNLIERSLLRTDESEPWMGLDLGWLRSRPPSSSGTPSPAGEGWAADRAGRSVVEQQEYELIRRTLDEEGGAIRRTAARLGMTHQSLLRRLQKWPDLRTSKESRT